jgi:hypothetical protein
MEANCRNAETCVVGRLGIDPSVMEAIAHIPERTCFIFRTIGIEERNYRVTWSNRMG